MPVLPWRQRFALGFLLTGESVAAVEPSTPAASKATPGGARHLPSLDGLRGIAVLLVLLHHLLIWPRGSTFHLPEVVANSMWVGVDLFFVLSGFLITGILLETKDRAGYFRNFYARRALRITPLYYGVLFVFFVVLTLTPLRHVVAEGGLSDRQAWLWTYCTNVRLALGHDWVFHNRNVVFDHFWTLAVEEHFYLVWPAVVLLLNRRGLLWLCAAASAAALALRLWLASRPGDYLAAYTLTPCRVDSLLVGAAVAAYSGGRAAGLSGLLRPARYAAAFLAVLLLTMFYRRRGIDFDDRAVMTYGFTLLALFFAAALVLAVEEPLARTSLSWNLLRMLGRYSYGIYIFHPMLMPASARLLAPLVDRFGFAGTALAFAVTSTAAVAVAALSYHFYELPFLRLKRFFESDRATAAAPVSSGAAAVP